MLWLDFVVKFKTVLVRNVFPDMLKFALSLLPVPLTNVYVNVSAASISVVVKVPTLVLTG